MQMQNIEALEGQALLRSNALHNPLGPLMVKHNLNDTQAHLDQLGVIKYSAEMLVKDLATVINQIALAEEEEEL